MKMNYFLAFCVCCSYFTIIQATKEAENPTECSEAACPENGKNHTIMQCKIWVHEGCGNMTFIKLPDFDPNKQPAESENSLCDSLQWDIAVIDIALMFFLPLAACFFPYYSQLKIFSFINVHKHVTWINCLGAGILLGTSFFHLLPEIGFEVDSLLKKQHLEKQKADAYEAQQQEAGNVLSRKRRSHGHSHDEPGGHADLTFEIYVIAGFFIILIVEQFVLTYFSKYFESLGVEHACQAGAELKNGVNEKDSLVSLENGDKKEKQQHHGHGHSHNMDPSDASSSTIRAIAFVASLAVHCVVEGAALTTRSVSWGQNSGMLMSIVFHKIPVGMTMGFLMESSKLKTKTAMIALFTWALFSPIGGIMGIGFCKAGWMDSALIPYLSAIGLGSFIYVLFFEVTPHEFLFKSEDNKFIKSLVMLAGCVLSFFVTKLFPCAHGHSHS